jgi:hypothetical protein
MPLSVHFDIENLDKRLRDEIETLSPYDWNALFNYFMMKNFKPEFLEAVYEKKTNGIWFEPFDDDEELVMVMTVMRMILKELPTFVLDPLIEKSIEDTTTDILRTKMPYPAFFLNKRFPYKDGNIMGIYVIDMEGFSKFCLMQDGVTKKTSDEIVRKLYHNVEEERFPMVNMYAIYVDPKNVHLFSYTVGELHNERNNKLAIGVMKKAMFYGLNISNLISAYVDIDFPNNPKRDVRITNKYDNNDKKHSKHTYSYIRVYGDLKRYTESYSKAKRRYTHSDNSVMVRGHFRHYKSERYTTARGTTRWIPPYIKGADEQLRARIIKIKP